MTPNPQTCRSSEDLERVAQLMRDHDVGSLPVVDDRGRLVGMITDRDALIAAVTRGEPLDEILVATVMTQDPVTVRADDDVTLAEELMAKRRVRRIPVVDVDDRVIGIIAMNDLIREARPDAAFTGVSSEVVLSALREIGRHRAELVPAHG